MIIKREPHRVYEFCELEIGDVFALPTSDSIFIKTEDTGGIDLAQGWWCSVDGETLCTKPRCELVVYD